MHVLVVRRKKDGGQVFRVVSGPHPFTTKLICCHLFVLFSTLVACDRWEMKRVVTLRKTIVQKNKPLQGAPGIHNKIPVSKKIQAFPSKKPGKINRMSLKATGF